MPSEESPEDGNRPLALLHSADIVRKHRYLLAWACFGGVIPVGAGRIGTLVGGAVVFSKVQQVEELASFQLVTGGLGVRFDLAFVEPGTLYGEHVIRSLQASDQAIREALNAFSS